MYVYLVLNEQGDYAYMKGEDYERNWRDKLTAMFRNVDVGWWKNRSEADSDGLVIFQPKKGGFWSHTNEDDYKYLLRCLSDEPILEFPLTQEVWDIEPVGDVTVGVVLRDFRSYIVEAKVDPRVVRLFEVMFRFPDAEVTDIPIDTTQDILAAQSERIAFLRNQLQ